jgi:hypothetical protein
LTIVYEIVVTGGSHTISQECIEDKPQPFVEVVAFCDALRKQGFHRDGMWWPPHEITRVNWRITE